MNKAFFVVALLCMLSAASAMVINAPTDVPENTNWSFFIELDSADGFDEVRVFIDGKQVVIAYPSGVVNKDPVNGVFVTDAFSYDKNPGSAAGLTVYISYFGLGAGMHNIAAESYKNSAKVSEDTATINVFSPLPYEFKEQMNTELNELKNLNDTLEQKLEELDTVLQEKAGSVEELQTLLQELQDAVDEYEENTGTQLESLSSTIKSMQRKLTENTGYLVVHDEYIEEQKEKSKQPDMLGFLNFGTNFPLGLIAILVVVIIVMLLLIFRDRIEGMENPLKKVSSPFGGEDKLSFDDSRAEESGVAEEEPAEEKDADSSAEEEDSWQGKWAMKGSKWEKKEPGQKKFSIGDLLRKKRE